MLRPLDCAAELIKTRDGREIEGSIVDQTEDGLLLETDHGRVRVPLADIVSLSPGAELSGDLSTLTAGSNGLLSDQAVSTQLETFKGSQTPPTEAELEALVDATLPEVSKLRGLAVLAAVRKRVGDKETIRRNIERELATQYPGETLARKGRAWARLGLLPADVDLPTAVLRLYTGQLAGMYDPESKALYLANWIPAAMQAGVVAHELVHALQDQHFDLTRYFDQVKGDADAQAARQAVVEGEATAVMLDYQLRDVGLSFESLGDITTLMDMVMRQFKQINPEQAHVPRFLEAQMLFPYSKGMQFIRAVRAQMPWSGVSVLYRDPPASTEQILHPDKYLVRRDDPRPPTLPDLSAVLGTGWTKADEDVLGEFGVGQLLGSALDPATAETASEGWDGDRYDFYEDAAGHSLLVWVTVWDTPSDAKEFAEAYQALLSAQESSLRPADQPGAWATASDQIRLDRRQDQVIIVRGWHEAPVDAALTRAR
ncbi:MAG: hypothetical protein HYZ92_06220 [Candidatus Omnitrophica bacterium]|nr:hypothetical protein [Candidatus Omnitrophota bacterium]